LLNVSDVTQISAKALMQVCPAATSESDSKEPVEKNALTKKMKLDAVTDGFLSDT
jgi:hypothetical protein